MEKSVIRIICGANTQELEVEETTVGELRSKLQDIMNIPSPSQAIIGGQTVDDSFVLRTDSQIEFVKPAGTKG